jgi:putative transposase
MLARVTLPSTVHHHAHFRVWQRTGYDINIWSAKKRDEKLNYMHNNSVKRGLVKQPGDWLWSSWRFYFLNDASLLAMDTVP